VVNALSNCFLIADARDDGGPEAGRIVFHNTISRILEPLYKVMEEGVSIKCGDGHTRLCFPRLSQYVADYEEQRVLAGILSGYCPKCTIPAFRTVEEDDDMIFPSDYPPRDGDHALEHRTRHGHDVNELKVYGYHPLTPFSEYHHHKGSARLCSIYEALAPDLLHQVSKNFFDYVYKIIKAAMIKIVGVSEKKLFRELDARFSQIPMFRGLKWFRKGISKIHRWTGKEYKNMLRVMLGVIRDIAPKDVVRFVRAFLDVHRMAHYDSHTDNEGRDTTTPGTLQLLADAIDKFRDCLTNPESDLVKHGIVKLGWYTPKIHYAHHYPDYIRQKGTLPQCSTDRSEALHRAVKRAHEASNKGVNNEDFITVYESRHTGLQIFMSELKAMGLDIGMDESKLSGDGEADDDPWVDGDLRDEERNPFDKLLTRVDSSRETQNQDP
jgi:Plavaka transposase